MDLDYTKIMVKSSIHTDESNCDLVDLFYITHRTSLLVKPVISIIDGTKHKHLLDSAIAVLGLTGIYLNP